MRRLLLSIFTFGFFLGMLTGCQNFFCHTAGVCDCDYDDDPCTHRAPWVRGYGAPAGSHGGVPIASGTTPTVPAQTVTRTK